MAVQGNSKQVSKQKPTHQDYYFLDDTYLTEEGKTVRDTARAYVAREIMPNIQRWDKGDIAPFKTHEDMIRAGAKKLAQTVGIFGASLKELGQYIDEPSFEPLSYTSYGVAMRELEAGDSTLRSVASVQSSLVMFAIYTYGTEEQKKKWLGPMHRGEKIGCFGLTEPQGGSDPGNMKTTAVKKGRSWIINGTKVWITNGFADIAVVWAKTDKGIRGFLVEKGRPGFTNRSEDKWTFRAGVASTLSFSNCEIPEENFLVKTERPAGKDLASPLSCLTEARYGICWGVIGAARACLDEVLRVTKEREIFGVPLAQKQEVQRKLVWCLNELENAQLVAYQLGRLKDEGRLSYAHVSLAKYNNVSKACDIARMCIELLPADVFTFDAYHSGRHFRNLEVVKKYEGTHEVHTFIVGREITGLNAF
ncbi:MAG: acyl-CoA dehydrogenase family protein [Elusimicrobia bacterium]|nr:acyl-CoA dehydrogenase family protein [Elusimicrobiota bacterium]